MSITITLIELELKRIKWEWTGNERETLSSLFKNIASKMFYAPHQIIIFNREILRNQHKDKTLDELDFNDGQTIYFFEEGKFFLKQKKQTRILFFFNTIFFFYTIHFHLCMLSLRNTHLNQLSKSNIFKFFLISFILFSF